MFRRKLNLNNKKGITLIALIVTIIVLLILAGVALNFIIGENGILKHAEFATEKYENKAQIEQNELAQLDDYISNGRDTVTIDRSEYEALKKQNSMSETEHFTGKYWLDGRKIYEITKIFTTDSNAGNLPSPVSMPDNVDNVTIDLSKSYILDKYNNIGYFNTSYDSTSYCHLYYNTSNKKFYYILGSTYTSCFATLTLQYTKTTDTATNN